MANEDVYLGLKERRKELLTQLETCDEFQKMISGQTYNPTDPLLIRAREQARLLTHKYNSCIKDDRIKDQIQTEEQKDIILSLFEKVDPDSLPIIEHNLRCDYGLNISIGRNCAFNFDNTFLDCGKIIIGNNVMTGPNVHIYAVTHTTDETHAEYTGPVTIGNNVWIGGNATILCNVTIGDGATVGAGSLVNRSVPAGAVVAGVPAKIIK